MHDYDVALKVLLQESAGLVMRELAGGITRWINVELPQVRNLRVDMLGETADGQLIHIELQSVHDAGMALRMAEYCLQVYRLYGRFPRQIVLYVCNPPARMKTELKSDDFSFRYRLVDIRELDADGCSTAPK
jgi:hypothetical protein